MMCRAGAERSLSRAH